uniref:Uncharacterized protein LOC101242455 n=1 Tax=Phallusia mammillata TaxID=59560 RepID=A0A6F9DJ90_9ASCI|nr:uncharacterized protein LOC101242455 [Phallusia mammillata]
MTEYDDMPPLEDMDNVVDRIKEMQVKKEKRSATHIKPQQTEKPKPIKVKAKPSKPSGSSFGGMQKGFLFGGKPASKPSPTQKVDYVVKPTTSSKNDLVFEEVQRSFKVAPNPFTANMDSWVNGDLFRKLDGNEKLMKQMAEPRFNRALKWMENDPKGAMEAYKDDTEVMEFLTEFCKILGEHFGTLGKKQPPKQKKEIEMPPHDEKKFKEILADPEIQEILAKQEIQDLFSLLRNEPEKYDFHMNACNPRMKADIKKLIAAGLLALEAR